MLEIKTITDHVSSRFDLAVNEALADGWELVRRECFITGSDRATTFYAELERMAEEQEPEDNRMIASWAISRDPAYPYKCTSCGFFLIIRRMTKITAASIASISCTGTSVHSV